MSNSGSRSTLETVYKVFSLIRAMSAPPYYTVRQLAERLERSRSVIYEYLKLLDRLGYAHDVNQHNQYFLVVDRDREASDVIDVTNARYLQELLWQMPENDPRRDELLTWVNRQYAVDQVLPRLSGGNAGEARRKLSRALEKGKRIRLYNYRKGQGELTNRYLEPVGFQEGYKYIWCYDLESTASPADRYRQFKLSRIGMIVVTEEPIENRHRHEPTDLFGWTGAKVTMVPLRLGPTARRLLLEEYPESRPFVVADGKNRWFAELPVRSFIGVGRWVCGLAHDVRVPEDTEAGRAFRAWCLRRFKGF